MFQTGFKLATVTLAAILLLVPTAQADDAKAARLLILEAAKLQKEALQLLPDHPGQMQQLMEQLIRENPGGPRGSDLLRQVQAKLQELVDTYPTTDEGMALALGDTVYGLNLAGLEQAIQEAAEEEQYWTLRIACATLKTLAPEDPGCKPFLDLLIDDYAKQKRTNDMIALSRLMQNPRQAVAALLFGHPDDMISEGRLEDAAKILVEAQTLMDTHGIENRMWTSSLRSDFGRIAILYARSGDFENARHYANLISHEGLRETSLRKIEDMQN